MTPHRIPGHAMTMADYYHELADRAPVIRPHTQVTTRVDQGQQAAPPGHMVPSTIELSHRAEVAARLRAESAKNNANRPSRAKKKDV